VTDLIHILQHLDVEQVDAYMRVLADARSAGKRVYVFGNGGSGATASHLSCDLNKGAQSRAGRFRVICLNDNVATLQAYANDEGYDRIFVEQLRNFLEPNAVVVGISGSGNSENIIQAIDYANECGALTVGLCGFSGGRLKEKAKVVVHVAADDMQKVEDVHAMLGHLAMQVLL
jgi:D-sedoheptulose 7-phosphate isomerase